MIMPKAASLLFLEGGMGGTWHIPEKKTSKMQVPETKISKLLKKFDSVTNNDYLTSFFENIPSFSNNKLQDMLNRTKEPRYYRSHLYNYKYKPLNVRATRSDDFYYLTSSESRECIKQNSSFESCYSFKKVRERSLSPEKNPFEDHSAKVLNYLIKNWNKGQLCDLIICLEGEDYELKAHKVVLAAFSQYWAKRISQMTPGIMKITLKETTINAIQTVLLYMYKANVVIQKDNIDAIVSCAMQLGIEGIIKECQQMLRDASVFNALRYLQIAYKCRLSEVAGYLYEYVCRHFLDIIRTEDFLQLSVNKLTHLLQNQNICVNRELEVFLALVRWVNFEFSRRINQIVLLIKCIRFEHITPEELYLYVEPQKCIFENSECRSMLNDAYRYHALKYSGSNLIKNFKVESPRRKTGFSNKCLPFCDETDPVVTKSSPVAASVNEDYYNGKRYQKNKQQKSNHSLYSQPCSDSELQRKKIKKERIRVYRGRSPKKFSDSFKQFPIPIQGHSPKNSLHRNKISHRHYVGSITETDDEEEF